MIVESRTWSARALGTATALLVLVTGGACDHASPVATTSPPAWPASTISPCVGLTSFPPVPPPSSWPSFKDPEYGFTISHPKGFPFYKMPRSSLPPSDHVLVRYDVADRCINDNPGASWGVEALVYTKDADTLTAWVQKHSDNAHCLGGPGILVFVTNVKAATAAGREALSLDEDVPQCGEGPGVAHVIVFFLDSSHVFMLRWYSLYVDYTPTVQRIAQEMLASFKG